MGAGGDSSTLRGACDKSTPTSSPGTNSRRRKSRTSSTIIPRTGISSTEGLERLDAARSRSRKGFCAAAPREVGPPAGARLGRWRGEVWRGQAARSFRRRSNHNFRRHRRRNLRRPRRRNFRRPRHRSLRRPCRRNLRWHRSGRAQLFLPLEGVADEAHGKDPSSWYSARSTQAPSIVNVPAVKPASSA